VQGLNVSFACINLLYRKLLIVLELTLIRRKAEKIGEPLPLNPPVVKTSPLVSAAASPEVAEHCTTPELQHVHAKHIAADTTKQQGTSTRQQNIFAIEGLSSYRRDWTIRAKVKSKSDIRTWSNQRGEGKLFSVTLLDQTGEIRATGFNHAVDQLYEQLQEGRTYFISKARVVLAKKKFSSLSNDFEIVLERSVVIEEVHYSFL
jgi:replication factor A1